MCVMGARGQTSVIDKMATGLFRIFLALLCYCSSTALEDYSVGGSSKNGDEAPYCSRSFLAHPTANDWLDSGFPRLGP